MRLKFTAALALGCGVVSGAADADPLTIVSHGSGVAAFASVVEGGTTDRNSYPYQANGNNTVTMTANVGTTTAVAVASISSNVSDPSNLFGSGTTSTNIATTTGTADASGLSNFSVEFLLATPHTYAFEAAFTASGNQSGDAGVWQTQLDGNNGVFLVSGAASDTVLRSGLLSPGLYRFLVGAVSSSRSALPGPGSLSAFSRFDFTFRLTAVDDPGVVPEPASLFLLGTGLAGIAAAARRRRSIG